MSGPRKRYILPPRTVMYLLATTFICSLVAGLSAVWWASQVDEKSNQRWCGMVVSLDNTYRDKPPNSDLGRQLATEFKQLRHDFGCNN